jgi:pyruvate carboxylase
VQTQIKIAGGASLRSLGLVQKDIVSSGVAIQCRVTTEDPAKDFAPDTGILDVFRLPAGMGIRIDDGPGFVHVSTLTAVTIAADDYYSITSLSHTHIPSLTHCHLLFV